METKIHITSDNHFNHKNIIKYCDRPFSNVEEMNEVMIKKWNEMVRKNDVVFHLGDFAKGNSWTIKKIRDRLNGIIILLKGNHDYKVNKHCGFIFIEGSIQIGNLILTHRPLPIEEIPEGFTNVHGHIHEKESVNGINVSVEKTGYKPIELNEVVVR